MGAQQNYMTTPTTVSLFDEMNSTRDEKPSVLEDTQRADALEEYLHLSAAAVKICFPMVPISSSELIQKAKRLPFYRVHDVLSRYMMQKLQWQETQAKKELDRKKEAAKAQEEADKVAKGGMLKKFRRYFKKPENGLNCTVEGLVWSEDEKNQDSLP